MESVLARPFQTFDGVDRCPGTAEKACRYVFGIIRNRSFLDGNKGTAAALMGTYLRISGVGFRPGHDELLKAMPGVIDGVLGYQDFLRRIQDAAGVRIARKAVSACGAEAMSASGDSCRTVSFRSRVTCWKRTRPGS